MSTSEKPAKAKRHALFARDNLLTSLMLVFPLWLAYQAGVIFLPDVDNGADLITHRLIALCGGSKGQYLALNAILAAAFLVLVLILRRSQRFAPWRLLPTVVESALYALTMGSLILYGMRLVGINPSLAVVKHAPEEVLTRAALALGAGVNEELVFRLGLLTGLTAFFEQLWGMRRWLAVAAGFVISAALFSAAHHVIGGEPWRLGPFVYRLGCGLFFAALYQWRGLAIAVYTHALYDLYVMVVQWQ